MKRLFLCLILAASFPILSHGQIRFGVRGGVNVSDFSLSTDVFNKSNITGFSGGLALDINFPLVGFGISSGLLYTQRGADVKIPVGEEFTGEESKNVRIGYLDIPAFLKWNFKIPMSPIGVFVKAGPYFSLAVDNKKAKEIVDAFGDFHNFDMGLGLGGGVSLFSKLEVEAYYGWGLTKAYENDAKNRGWNISAAYFF
ncbi:MAG: PorT family protein [Candidatus Azobacteroides sp.]|nr:PorT family protein [Candidatus Azobacteroides sp.]